MKKLSSLYARVVLCILFAFLLTGNTSEAQCVAPSLEFQNPSLVSGTAGQPGAVYKFPNITYAIDAYIRIDSLVGGASLIDIDVTGYGYDYAWQPRIEGPTSPVGNKSYIRWSIFFKAVGTNAVFLMPCMSLGAIDIDGDNSGIREFIQAMGVTSFTNTQPSDLTITQEGSDITALGSVTNKVDIDTLAYETRILFNFSNVSGITVKTGAIVNNSASNMMPQRYNCLYFKNLAGQQSTLPVRLLSFTARGLKNNEVQLNWVTEIEVNNKQFEIQRSTDGKDFSTVAMFLSIDGSSYKAYQFKDKLPSGVTGKVFYRIRQIDIDNKYSLSKIIPVNLSKDGELFVKMTPNPVENMLTINVENNSSPARSVRITDLTGRETYKQNISGLSTRQIQLNAQQANMSLPGMSIAEVFFEDGTRVSQKIIKR
jgi:hypothetical protein